ncbi:LamG-like jellyroll fold domain-containing protein [archaeon]
MRGQGASEFLLLLSFILLLILPVGYYIFTNTTESSRVLEADLAVSALTKTANYVYYQSPGAKQVVTVFLPGGIEWADSYIGHPTESGGEEINLALYTQTGGTTDIIGLTEGEVRGTWPDSNGNYRFMVRKTADGYVIIGPYEQTFLLEPQSYTTTMVAGALDSFTITATELEGSDRTLTLTPGGEIATWLSLGTSSLDLAADAQNTTLVNITVPAATPAGVYTGTVDATDGEVTDVVYITVISLGPVTPPGGIEGGLLVNITHPTNTTYTEWPIDLNYTVNATPAWCGYTLDGSVLTTIDGNVTMLPTNGSHYVTVLCVSADGKSGTDDEWFSTDFGNEPWCFNLTMLWAYNSTYDDVMPEIFTSNDVYADEHGILEDALTFIDATFEFAINPNVDDVVIHNMSQGWEHYESDAQIDPVLQWQLNNGWGGTVCQLPAYSNPAQEALDVCTLSEEEVPATPGEVLILSTRVYYLSQSASAHEAHIDWTYLTVCYGEAITELNIISPTNTNYSEENIWFNISSNSMMDEAWFSLDGAANHSLGDSGFTASHLTGVGFGEHNVTFYANDSNGNIMSNWTTFNRTGGAVGGSAPTHLTPILNATSANNLTADNLTCWNQSTSDPDGDAVKNIFNWKKDGEWAMGLNMPFEGGSNSTWMEDYSGNDNHGTNTGSTWDNTTGYDGWGSYHFDGATDYITVADSASINFTGPFTVSLWAKAEVAPDQWDTLLVKATSDWWDDGYALFYDSASTVKFYLNGFDEDFATASLTPTQWNHIVGVYNGSALRIFVNGTEGTPDTSITGTGPTNAAPIRIGSHDGGYEHQGWIDDILVFNHSLSPEQVTALYNNQTNLIVSQETDEGDVWQCEITPNDGGQDGLTKTSNTLTIADSVAPVITIVSPTNTTYNETWVWMNITLDESGSWAGYSLDGAANVTMTGSGTSWYYNASGLAETGHTVVFYANDSWGNMGVSAMRWFTIDTAAVSACPYTIDAWELDTDKPQPIEFTSGLNTTANTFGIGGASDGWDWAWDVYDSGSTCVYFNGNAYVSAASPTTGAVNTGVNADDLIRIDIGDSHEVGDSVCNLDGHGSGAYAVKLDVTGDMWSEIASGGTATVYFDWSFTDYALDSGDDAWVKARFGNSTTMTYLGTQVGGGNDDADADIMFQSNPADTSGSEAIDVTSLITEAGSHYLELGARVFDWDNNEGGNFEFDNVDLNVSCAP